MKQNKLYRALSIILILNFILAAIKLGFGLLGHSIALTHDGINSLIDFILSIILVLTIRVSNKEPDKEHPYGHEKFEGVLSLIIGMLVIITGLFLVFETIVMILTTDTPIKPEIYTVIVAIISVCIKVFLYKFTKHLSIKFSQPGLKADSINHFADAAATSIVVIGIFLALLGYSQFDYIASTIIAIIITYSGVKLFLEATSWLVDKAPDKEYLNNIRSYILKCSGVIDIDEIKARMHVTKLYVDVEITVDNSLSLIEAHKIAEKVHLGIEKEFLDVIHCMVHVNPADTKSDKV